ncbi:MAG TPA: hypothetical protein VIS52_07570, partial [Motiliproteus sp.]
MNGNIGLALLTLALSGWRGGVRVRPGTAENKGLASMLSKPYFPFVIITFAALLFSWPLVDIYHQ